MEYKTKVINIDFKEFDLHKAEIIRDILNQDGVIIYPTDTIYGLGGNCFSQKVIRRIFDIKYRSKSKALAVVVSDQEMMNTIVSERTPFFEKLAKNFWPGPLTLILHAASQLPSDLLGPGGSLAVRQPGLGWLRRLISFCGYPLVSTSANLSGQESILDPEQAYNIFKGKVDLVIDGGRLPEALPSTVVDLTLSEPKIIREGVISAEKLMPYLIR